MSPYVSEGTTMQAPGSFGSKSKSATCIAKHSLCNSAARSLTLTLGNETISPERALHSIRELQAPCQSPEKRRSFTSQS